MVSVTASLYHKARAHGSAVDGCESRLVVAAAADTVRDAVEALQIVFVEAQRERAGVLVDAGGLRRPRDRDHVLTAAEHPGQRDLRRSGAVLDGYAAHDLDDRDVTRAVLAGEARLRETEVVLRERLGIHRAGEKTATERAVRHEADAELEDRREHLVLDVAGPQRVLALHRCDRMRRVGAADRRRRGLGEAQEPYLAGGDRFGHRADGLFDRHLRIDAVLVPQVDVADAKPLERALEGPLRVGGRAVDAVDALTVGREREAELRRELDLVAAAGDRGADDFLVAKRPVDLGGVDHRDAEIERPADRLRPGLLGRRPVGERDTHAAEAQRGGLQLAEAASCDRAAHDGIETRAWGGRVSTRGGASGSPPRRTTRRLSRTSSDPRRSLRSPR